MKKIFLMSITVLSLFLASCGESKSENSTEAETSTEELEAQVQEPEVQEPEVKPILEPGVTYVSPGEKGHDMFGQEVLLTMEFTVYNDGSATGNLIEKDSRKSYDHPMEGSWKEVSKHDKRMIKLDIDLTDGSETFTYYVDEELNCYKDLNKDPIKLTVKN